MRPQPQPIPSEPPPTTRSGGPKTPEGKERSRRNALKHGLRAKVLTPDEMIDDVITRTADFAKELQPRTAYQEWLVAQIALATVQLDRCAALGIVDLQRRINHAEPCWELDRRRDVAALGARLKHDPVRVLRALEATRHGVEWLLDHWIGLSRVAPDGGRWDEAQTRLALDLLGTPPEQRQIRYLPGPTEVPQFVAEQMVRLLGLKQSSLNDLDEDQRFQASLGMPTGHDPTTASLQRYERSCRRTLQWARGELQRLQAEPADSFTPDSKPEPELVPDPVPPRASSDPHRNVIAGGKPAPVPQNHARQLPVEYPTGNHATLDLAMIPPRPAVGPGSPRPAGAGHRA
jgi:hypothetical protein